MQDPAVPYIGRTIAVTGAFGSLGSALGAALAKSGARQLLLVRRPGSADRLLAGPPGAKVLVADVREQACWNEIVRWADVIFHLAGNTSVSASVSDPANSLASAVLPLTHLVSAAREAGRAPRLVYASSARVYGNVRTLPVREDVDPQPATPFGLHNLLAERELARASAERVVEAVSLRLGNVYGPSPCDRAVEERNVLNTIARRALRGEDLPLFGDGNYLRDYVYIDDVVRAFLMVGGAGGLGGQSFNVASGCGVTVRNAFHLIAARAAHATGRSCRVREVPWPDGETALECRDFVADISRIATACGWTSSVALPDGIDRLIDNVVA